MRPPTTNCSLTASGRSVAPVPVLIVFTTTRACTGPTVTGPSVTDTVALTSPAIPAGVIRNFAVPPVSETPFGAAPRKSEMLVAATRTTFTSSVVFRTVSAPAFSTCSNENAPPSCWPKIEILSLAVVATSSRTKREVGDVLNASATSMSGMDRIAVGSPSTVTRVAMLPETPASEIVRDAVWPACCAARRPAVAVPSVITTFDAFNRMTRAVPTVVCSKEKSPEIDWPSTVSVSPVPPTRTNGVPGLVSIASDSVPPIEMPGTFTATVPAIVPAIPRPVVIVNVPFAFVIETTSVVPVPSRSAAFLTLIVVVPVADCTVKSPDSVWPRTRSWTPSAEIRKNGPGGRSRTKVSPPSVTVSVTADVEAFIAKASVPTNSTLDGRKALVTISPLSCPASPEPGRTTRMPPPFRKTSVPPKLAETSAAATTTRRWPSEFVVCSKRKLPWIETALAPLPNDAVAFVPAVRPIASIRRYGPPGSRLLPIVTALGDVFSRSRIVPARLTGPTTSVAPSASTALMPPFAMRSVPSIGTVI